MYIPRQNAPIRRTLAAMLPDDDGGSAEPATRRAERGAPGLVPSGVVNAFMHAIRGPAKDGCEGPILVVPNG
jgi:hypothetical protein